MIYNNNSASDKPWELIPLTPEYIEAEHFRYVAAIEEALACKDIRNIALSGNYGVGKSSILQEVARRQDGRVVEISLSTLSPIETSKLDDSVPKQATTPTNRIQQEIVKQMLYREKPSKTPGSRFRRIERFRWQWEFGTAALLGFVFSIIFLLTGWTAQIVSAVPPMKDLGTWVHAIIFGMATGSSFLVRKRFYGKLRIKQFSAGAATVTLDDNSVSYFDQYLDEIVYFFEVSERNVVIFEDIDRFNDSHIFETLRALNTLLNSSPQIKKTIRFIYAVKDSIFDAIALKEEGRKLEASDIVSNDPVLLEVVRANRTKFFDLIIPVVPFITHRSARNLAMKQLGQTGHKIAPELIDLVAQFVPDMRLLKNVRNEFIIFRDRIFSGDGEKLKLNETELFAMVLYKNTHLTDFEAIRLGKSKLDTLYKSSREIVTNNIRKLEDERTILRQRLEMVDGTASRCEQLGELLLAHIKRTAEAVEFPIQNASYTFNGTALNPDELKGAQFWKEFASTESNVKLNFRNRHGQTMNFSRNSLSAALDNTLDVRLWDEADREMLCEEILLRTNNIRFLRSADLNALIKRPEFLINEQETDQSLEKVARSLLKSGLAYQLVRAGYINRNFTLYTSTFHGDRVSTAATNFIIHHVEQDLMDVYFELEPEDVDAVVREKGQECLKESALYNIAILDHLLATDPSLADIMIQSLLDFRENAEKFIQAYLESGERRPLFIQQFTAFYSKIIPYLVNQTMLDDLHRLQFVNIALSYLPSIKQRTDSSASTYLLRHYTEFSIMTSESANKSQAERIGTLFSDSHIIVPRLHPLSRQVRISLISHNLYEVTFENLTIAINNTRSVALDVILSENQKVYRYVLVHLSAYLECINDLSATIDDTGNFIEIIQDVLELHPTLLSDVIEHSSSNCVVEELSEVSVDAWPLLARHCRFPATFNNVSCYVAALEKVDENLAKILTASGSITEINSDDEDAKNALAVAILGASQWLPSASVRVELVRSLELEEYIDVNDVMAETGELFELLLQQNMILDDVSAYEHLSEMDWPTKSSFICASQKFSEYMTPELIHNDLAALLQSDAVDLEIKKRIVEEASAYLEVAGPEGTDELARFASENGLICQPSVVNMMAQGGASTNFIILLLEPHLDSMSRELLFSILKLLGGDYPDLTEVGHDKPRIPNTPENRALLEHLRQEGIVGKYDVNESPIKVNKRYK
ncbi:hypothetical protein ACIP6T_24335 [Pantoea sp. NPDC088449]|uniref:YobI family P-loop NTPase n=1 Tax=Pantoea sp. NPDC088449 TaxID=3364392 RepID=UPI0038199E71